MLKAIGGALLASFVVWIVMRETGNAGPDADLYSDMLRGAWKGAVGAFWWLLDMRDEPQRLVLVLAAVVGGMLGAKS